MLQMGSSRRVVSSEAVKLSASTHLEDRDPCSISMFSIAEISGLPMYRFRRTTMLDVRDVRSEGAPKFS